MTAAGRKVTVGEVVSPAVGYDAKTGRKGGQLEVPAQTIAHAAVQEDHGFARVATRHIVKRDAPGERSLKDAGSPRCREVR